MWDCDWMFLRVCISVWMLENYCLLFVQLEDQISLEWLDGIRAISSWIPEHLPETAPFYSLDRCPWVKAEGWSTWPQRVTEGYRISTSMNIHPTHLWSQFWKTHPSQPRPKLHIPLRSDSESGCISPLLPLHKGMSYAHAEKNATE